MGGIKLLNGGPMDTPYSEVCRGHIIYLIQVFPKVPAIS